MFSLMLGGLNTPVTAQTGSIAVANPSFETPTISNYDEVENGYTMSQAGQNPVWTISDYAGIGLAEYFNKDAAGHGQAAPDGDQVGYVQSYYGIGSLIQQTLSGFQSGQSYYVIVAAAQAGGNTGGVPMPVLVTLGAQSYTFTPSSTQYQDYTLGPFPGTAGSQTLRFATITQPSSKAALVMFDNVRVVPASGVYAVPPGVSIPNFSFEAPTISSYYEFEDGYQMMQAGANVGWTLSAYSGIGLAEYFNKDASGFGQIAPDGNQVAYVQSYYGYAPGTISQTVSGFQPGQSYYLIVSAAQQGGSTGGLLLPVVASLGGQTYLFTPSSTQYQDYTFGPVTASAASATVGFMAVPQDPSVAATALLDNVRVVLSAGPFTPTGLSLYPASVPGGTSSLGTVTLSNYAPTGGVVVTLSSSSPAATVPASVTVPGGQVSATFPVSTTSVNAATTATITATAAGVSKTATLTVNPAPRFKIININNGDTLSGDFAVNVSVLDGNLNGSDIFLSVDGTSIDSGDIQVQADGSYAVAMVLPTNNYSNGAHLVAVVDGLGHRDTRNVTFSNAVANIVYDPIFDVSSSAGGVSQTSHFSAMLAVPQAWQVAIQDYDGNTVRSYSGNGTSIDLTWDGKNSQGSDASPASYDYVVTADASGDGAVRALGDGGATPVHRPVAKDSIGDSLILIDQSALIGGSVTGKAYAKFITGLLAPKVGIDFTSKPMVILTTGANVTAYKGLRNRINYKLEIPCSLVYVYAHGSAVSKPRFKMGTWFWYPHLPLIPEIGVPLNQRVDVSSLTESASYGNPNDPPILVWMDTCDSAGINALFPDYSWADPFSSDSGGAFVGWAGPIRFYGYPPISLFSCFTAWRNNFWINMFQNGQNVQTAISNANKTPGQTFGPNLNPNGLVVLYGIGSVSF